MKPLDPVSAIALILIASFAIDRVVTAIMFLLTFAGWAPDPVKEEQKYKLIYYLIGGALGIFVLGHFGQVRLLTAMGIPIDRYLDTGLTGIVLVGGADRIAGLLKPGSAPQVEQPPAPPPVVITGKLVLDGTPQSVQGQTAEKTQSTHS